MKVFALLSVLLSAPPLFAGEGTVAPAVLEAEAQRIAVMAKAKDTVVAVFASTGQGGGSGVVISADGYALSNFHVVKPCGNAMKCGMADGKAYDAVVVGIDPTGDVALIKLLGRDDFPHAELGDSDQLRTGDWVFAMGNPFLLATDFQPTVTYGIVSGIRRYQFPDGTLLEYTDCIQTDASINPGNSGGPLFNAAGQVVGINGRCSFEKRGRVNVGVGYAISINQIKNFLGCLHSGRIVDHATLGARVTSDEAGRVLVSDILEQSDAARRGLRYDDEIVKFAGRDISTPNAFKNVLGIYPKGWRVPVSYVHEGKRSDVMIRLAGVHSKEELIEKAMGRPPQPMPLPKPEKPDPKAPNDKDGSKPKPKPLRIKPGGPNQPLRMTMPQAPMPEIVKKHFQEKRGYANYYFNKLHQERVWKAWRARGDFSGLGGTWTLAGKLDSGSDFRFEIADDGGALVAPVGETKWTAGKQFGDSLLPTQSGGLLPSLFLWRRLALEGIERFGDVYYLGTAPWPGREGLLDVLVGTCRGVECWFYFDPAAGRLLALEMYANDGTDPCEVRFDDYRDVDGRSVPGRMDVRWGDDPYGTFKFEEFKFEKKGEKVEKAEEAGTTEKAEKK